MINYAIYSLFYLFYKILLNLTIDNKFTKDISIWKILFYSVYKKVYLSFIRSDLISF